MLASSRTLDTLAVIQKASGWPSRSLSWRATSRSYLSIDSDQVRLPLRPIWPGFAINTLFYAVALWLLFAAPFALRRRRRIKRGWCLKCGYDLRAAPTDSTACPEYGTMRR